MGPLQLSRVGVLFSLVVAVLLTGCAGYRLGPTNGAAAGARSIEIRPFANQTFEPRLTEAVTQQLRKQLQHDGTFRLATQGGADVTVTGSIVKYEREPLSFQPRDVITTRDYSVNLTAHVRALDNGTGLVLLDREVAGRTTVRNVPDLGSASPAGPRCETSPTSGAPNGRPRRWWRKTSRRTSGRSSWMALGSDGSPR